METTEQCPLCGTELSRIKFREIQSKLREEEQRNAAELAQAELATRQRLEQQFKLDLEKHKQAAEKKARGEADQEIKKVAAERDQNAKKLQEAQQREAAIRKEAAEEISKQNQAAEAKAKKDAEAQIKKVSTERDQFAKKLEQAQAREAELVKRAQEEAEKQGQKELANQRLALEKDKNLALLKQQSEFNRQRESLQKKVQGLERQVQKKTANELGDGAEIDLFEVLCESFPGDKIIRIPKGQAGADILHEVQYKGEPCGKIIFDSKNHQGWQSAFVTKLRQDQVEANAEHAILTTSAFPASKKELCIESGVILVAPARAVHIVQLLRDAMVTMHVKGLSIKERSTKMTRLYNLITSESYSKKFSQASKLADEILELDVQEKKQHDNTWKKRGTLAKQINNVLREVETDVAAVVEGSTKEEAPTAYPVRSVPGNGDDEISKETLAWSKH